MDSGKLHDVLEKYGIANSIELYQGTHTSKVADRFLESCDAILQAQSLFQDRNLPVDVCEIIDDVTKENGSLAATQAA